MKKLIFLIVCLFVLTTWAYSQIEFSLYYEPYSLRSMGLKEETIISQEGIEIGRAYWGKERLVKLNTQESFNSLVLKASYSWSRFTLNMLAGISTMKSSFTNMESIQALYFDDALQFEYPPLERKNAEGETELGLLAGIGMNFLVYKNNGFELEIISNYLYRKNSANILLLEEWFLSGYYWGWIEADRTITINKVKSQELMLGINVSKKIGKVVLSGGPIFFWAETAYTGKTIYNYSRIYMPEPIYNTYLKNRTDFELKTTNNNKMGAVFAITYPLTENINFFIETQFIVQDKVLAGIKFRV